MKEYLVVMKKFKPAIIHYIHRRVKVRNQNCLVCATGGTGSGKSYSMISLAQAIAKYNGVEFDTRHICMTSAEFMRLVNSNELKRGSVIIMDEAGVAVNAKKWQSQINIVMNYIVQTFRHRNYVVIMNSPDFSFIDKSIRKMFHLWIATDHIDYVDNVCKVKPYVLSTDQKTGDQKTWFFRVKMEGMPPYKVERTGFKLADSELLRKYEIKKEAFTDELNKRVQDILIIEEEMGQAELTDQQSIVLSLWNDYGFKQYEIARVLRINQGIVSTSLKACRKKGHLVNKGTTAKRTISDEDLQKAYEEAKARLVTRDEKDSRNIG